MFIKNGKRFNLQGYLSTVWVDDQGIQHPGSLLLNASFRAEHGIEEIPDPDRGNDDTEITQEIDESPYIRIISKTTEQINEILIKKLSQAVQSYLDTEARKVGYDDIVSACSYAGAPNAFQQESISFLNWRSACWTHSYQVLEDVTNGTRIAPTAEELLSELPQRVIPS